MHKAKSTSRVRNEFRIGKSIVRALRNAVLRPTALQFQIHASVLPILDEDGKEQRTDLCIAYD